MNKDVNKRLVIDNGTDYMKVGFAGANSPQDIFPTIMGSKINYRRGFSLARVSHREDREYIDFDGAQSGVDSPALSSPIDRGIVTNWDDMERIWHHVFYNYLRIAPEECMVLMSEVPFNPKANKNKTTQIMFEAFNIPFFYLCITPLLSLYASGRNTCLVIDSGDGATHVVPIFKYHPYTHAVQCHDIRGRAITEYLIKLLCKRGYSFPTAAEREKSTLH